MKNRKPIFSKEDIRIDGEDERAQKISNRANEIRKEGLTEFLALREYFNKIRVNKDAVGLSRIELVDLFIAAACPILNKAIEDDQTKLLRGGLIQCLASDLLYDDFLRTARICDFENGLASLRSQ